MNWNEKAAALLEEIRSLSELNGENPFKTRAYEKAIPIAQEATDLEQRAKNGTLTELAGIGKGISEILTEFLKTGESKLKTELVQKLPEGLLELVKVPGLGPKKAKTLIEDLGIKTLAELEYACRENRLLTLKGFGDKLQTRILEGVRFLQSTQGQMKWVDAAEISKNLVSVFEQTLNSKEVEKGIFKKIKDTLQDLEKDLKLNSGKKISQITDQNIVSQADKTSKIVKNKVVDKVTDRKIKVLETGALRRRLEVLDELHYLVVLDEKYFESKIPLEKQIEKISEILTKILTEQTEKQRAKTPFQLPVVFSFTSNDQLGADWVRTTSSSEHWAALGFSKAEQNQSSNQFSNCKTEQEFYSHLKLPLISAEMRETGEEVTLAKTGKLEKVLPEDAIQGVFHNHTTRSDGVNTLEEMVLEAQKLGYRYIGISDHSQSAFYAQGLKSDALKEQEKEIRKTQEKYPDIRIFWGIESDILADGSLDYPDSLLKRFDFVIASIHSRFGMDRTQMTERLLNAVKNPYTRFLGHMTGRLLLGRPAYDFDVPAVIEQAAQSEVAIEINANPARLDIDWRWGKELRKNGTMVSVNPDAHEIAGLQDTAYGVTVARKALLPSAQVLNSKNVSEVEKWLKRA